MKEDKKEKLEIFIDTLTDTLGRSDGQSIEEVKNDLREERIDVDATINKLSNMVLNASKVARRKQLDLAKEKRQEMESKKINIISKFDKWTKEEIISKIKETAALLGSSVSVSYRDLDSQNTEDLKSLLEDIEIARQHYENKKNIDGE